MAQMGQALAKWDILFGRYAQKTLAFWRVPFQSLLILMYTFFYRIRVVESITRFKTPFRAKMTKVSDL